MDYATLSGFEKDFTRLEKRFRSLKEDFEKLKKFSIELYHEQSIDNRGIVKVEGWCGENYTTFKIRKFACRALRCGANSGLRVIYVHQPMLNKITFIEIYFKADQENETRNRIKEFLKTL